MSFVGEATAAGLSEAGAEVGAQLAPKFNIPLAVSKAGPIEINGYRLAKHGEMPTPRLGRESHHGAMSKWMEEHFSGYNPDQAPAVLMPSKAHDLTRGVYNTWRAEMRREMGGKFEWGKVSESNIRTLSDRMFQASKTPVGIQSAYWQWFESMKAALQRQKAAAGL